MTMALVLSILTVALIPAADSCRRYPRPFGTLATVQMLAYPSGVDGPGWVDNASCLSVFAFSHEYHLYDWVREYYPGDSNCTVRGDPTLSREAQLVELEQLIADRFQYGQGVDCLVWNRHLYYEFGPLPRCIAGAIMFSVGIVAALFLLAALVMGYSRARSDDQDLATFWLGSRRYVWGTPPPRYDEDEAVSLMGPPPDTPPGTPPPPLSDPPSDPPSYHEGMGGCEAPSE